MNRNVYDSVAKAPLIKRRTNPKGLAPSAAISFIFKKGILFIRNAVTFLTERSGVSSTLCTWVQRYELL